MKLYETKIKTGGLYRCCIATIHDLNQDVDYQEGQVVDCKFEEKENQKLVLKDGIWQWNVPEISEP